VGVRGVASQRALMQRAAAEASWPRVLPPPPAFEHMRPIDWDAPGDTLQPPLRSAAMELLGYVWPWISLGAGLYVWAIGWALALSLTTRQWLD
jgi:hypothetical protein